MLLLVLLLLVVALDGSAQDTQCGKQVDRQGGSIGAQGVDRWPGSGVCGRPGFAMYAETVQVL